MSESAPRIIGPDRKHSRHGYAHDVTADLWPRLVDALLELRHAAVILSGYPNEEVGRLGWRAVELRALKNVQARAGGKLGTVPETLWLSPAVVDAPNLFSDLPQLEEEVA